MMKYCYLCRRMRDLIYFLHPNQLDLYDLCSHCRPGCRSPEDDPNYMTEADARYICEEMSMDYDGPFGVGPVRQHRNNFYGEDPIGENQGDREPFPEGYRPKSPISTQLNKEDFRNLLVEHGLEHFVDDCELCNPRNDQDSEGHDSGHHHDHGSGPGSSLSPCSGPVFGPDPPPGHKYGHKKHDPKIRDTKKHDPYKHDPKHQAGIDYLNKKYGSSIDIKTIDPNLPRQYNNKNVS